MCRKLVFVSLSVYCLNLKIDIFFKENICTGVTRVRVFGQVGVPCIIWSASLWSPQVNTRYPQLGLCSIRACNYSLNRLTMQLMCVTGALGCAAKTGSKRNRVGKKPWQVWCGLRQVMPVLSTQLSPSCRPNFNMYPRRDTYYNYKWITYIAI